LSTPSSHYRPDLDGLRAIAVLAVVIHHLSPESLSGGYIGVDVFFVISGYLITTIIKREIEEGPFGFARFYERRVRRLFPALFAVLTATLVAGFFVLLPSDYEETHRATLGTLFFSSNMVFWREMAAGYFAQDAKLNPLLHTWSLGVEEQFYFLYPMLLVLCHRHFPRYLVLLLCLAAFVSLGMATLWITSHSVAIFFLSPFRAWELLAGALVAYGVVPEVHRRDVRETLAGLGLLAMLVPAFHYDADTVFPGASALLPVLGTAMLIHIGSHGGPLSSNRLLTWRPFVYIGLISYSLYLWHWPLIVLFRFNLAMDSIEPYGPAVFLASLTLASLSYHFIEKPFRRPGVGSRRMVFSTAAMAGSALACAAIAGIVLQGVPQRVTPQALAFDGNRVATVSSTIRACERRVHGPWTEWCRVGPTETPSTVLVWGDSHLMAWMPVLDPIFTRAGIAATIVAKSACPPLFDVDGKPKSRCRTIGDNVSEFLTEHPDVHTIVMSAFWGTYLGDGSFVVPDLPDPEDGGVPTVAKSFSRTLRLLGRRNINVVVIGPIPTYARSVPMVLAWEANNGRIWEGKSAQQHRIDNAIFFGVLNALEGDHIKLMDPSEWMCAPVCAVEVGGTSLYRDDNHLSVYGAEYYANAFSRSLMDALSTGDKTPSPAPEPASAVPGLPSSNPNALE
jgi:peptidoglycan/LPS O-acetylase OafA/YrhL